MNHFNKIYLLKPAFFLLALCLPVLALATHNKAGEITFKRVGDPGDFIYDILVTTYTDSRSVAAHRDAIEVFFGHGSPEESEIVSARVNCEKVDLGNNTWMNCYQVRHRFPGAGECYIISFNDPNRVSEIININDSNSVNIPFYIQSELCIWDATGETSNNSPDLLEPPISFACQGQRYIHNPNAFDIDGDRLTYEVVDPMMSVNKPVPNFESPEGVNGNEGGTFTLDTATGELIWDVPKRIGLYNIAIRITEWREVKTEGSTILRKMGYITRDMQIEVLKCHNEPPEIEEIEDVCVLAGSSPLTIKVTATDPDLNDVIHLTAGGGPFELDDSPARTWPDNLIGNSPVSHTFYWEVKCEHIREEPYSVVFNATDGGNGFPGQVLTDLEHVSIRVIGPEPKNLEATPGGNTIYLNWQAPNCDAVVSYIVYRKANPSDWDPDDCETGVPAYTGFKKIATVPPDQLSFADDRSGDGLKRGPSYCYRVTALYKNEGQFAQSEGLASEEVCAELPRDVPMIIGATVESTSISIGETTVKWGPPVDLDTVAFAPPYRFILSESTDLKGSNLNELFTRTYTSYYEMTRDFTHTSTTLNTLSNPHSYQIDFVATDPVSGDDAELEPGKSASTPWIEITPGDKMLILKVMTDVPWKNDSFIFYRRNRQTGLWDSIGYSKVDSFIDSGLVNGREYCYKAKTIGYFPAYPEYNPVINWSQENCERPRDQIPPCAPVLTAEAICDLFKNQLSWKFKDDGCSFDVVKYQILYQRLGKGPYNQIATVNGSNGFLSFDDEGRDDLLKNLAGCYKIIAVDSFDNLSDSSNAACVDNCPLYILPNVITPNGDDWNDFFLPKDYRFVDSLSITIFNRWGQQVYSGNEVEINWDGVDQNTGKPLSPGAYFYVADVTFLRLKENETTTISGLIHIIR